MQYEYFYGAQAEQFSFYRIPKALFIRRASRTIRIVYLSGAMETVNPMQLPYLGAPES